MKLSNVLLGIGLLVVAGYFGMEYAAKQESSNLMSGCYEIYKSRMPKFESNEYWSKEKAETFAAGILREGEESCRCFSNIVEANSGHMKLALSHVHLIAFKELTTGVSREEVQKCEELAKELRKQ